MCVRGVVRLEWRKFLRAICFWWRRRVSIDSSLVQSSSITYLDPGHKFIGFIRPRLLKSTHFFKYLKILVSLCTFLGKHTWCWQFHKSIPVKYKCIQVLHMMYFYVVREIYALTGLIWWWGKAPPTGREGSAPAFDTRKHVYAKSANTTENGNVMLRITLHCHWRSL